MEAAQPVRYVKKPIRLSDREWDAEIRGGLVALKGRLKTPVFRRGGLRSTIRQFTRQSRFRMFKMIATLDWRQAGKGLFVTLTFPDAMLPCTAKQRMRWLAEWFRKLELYLGRQVSAVWRCEWAERLSGEHKGMFLPHYHLLIFSVSYVPWQTIRKLWRDTLGYDGYVRTDVRRLSSKKDHGVYIAKYCAKMPDVHSLVNVAYSRIDGRHWGYYRQRLLPRAERMYFSDLSLATVMTLRDIADRELPWYDIECDAGFALIGTAGERLAKACLDFCLDDTCPDG
jgi:hypothetical protein